MPAYTFGSSGPTLEEWCLRMGLAKWALLFQVVRWPPTQDYSVVGVGVGTTGCKPRRNIEISNDCSAAVEGT